MKRATLIALIVLILVGWLWMTRTARAADCSQTLQSLIDAAPDGSTLSVPPCVYRESVTVTKPLTIDGQNAAEIRGSDVWSGWTQNGSSWVSQLTVPDLPFYLDTSRCADGTDRCLHPEQVYLDGQPVPFTLDAARHVILATNPTGHVVEVTTRSLWLHATADNVTVKNMTMRHAGNDAQNGAVTNWGGLSADVWHSGFALDHDTLLYAHGSTVGLCCAGQTGIRITNSELAYAGQEGIAAYQVPNLVISGNHIHDNSVAGFNCDWECGGLKLVSVPGTQVVNNEIDHNMTGLWFDIGASGGLAQGNNAHDNSRVGIYVEISHDMQILSNTLTDNGMAVGVATSANVEVAFNTLQRNTTGIVSFVQSVPDAPDGAGTGINIHDNMTIQPPTSTPTATATPRPTSTPKPTATPRINCQVEVWLNGVSQGRKGC